MPAVAVPIVDAAGTVAGVTEFEEPDSALLPLAFVGVATETAGYQLITETFIPKMIRGPNPSLVFQGWLLAALCAASMAALVWIFLESLAKWVKPPMPAAQDKRG